MKRILITLSLVAVVLLCTPRLFAQTYAPRFSTKLVLGGNSGGVTPLTLQAPTSGLTGYTLTLPTAQGTGVLTNDGTGTLTWSTAFTGVVADAPLTGNGTSGSHLAIPAANGSTNGYLSSGDWTTFNNKLTTVSVTAPITGDGTSGNALAMAAANGTTNGYLSSADWTAFNGKQNALTLGNLTSTDITVTGGTGAVIGAGTSMVIANNAVTYAKMQAVSGTSLLLGSSASTTAVQEITLGGGLSMTGNTLSATGSGGTVTTFSFTNANGVSGLVTNASSTPNLTLTLGAITPSSVAATGTVTGSNLSGTNTGDQTITLTGDVTGTGTGSFAATISNASVTYAKMQSVSATSKLLGSSSTTTPVQEITLGSGLTMTGTTLSATASGSSTLFARKTGDVILATSNTTLQNDPDLTVALAANSTYEFSGVIAYNGSNKNSDLKLAITVPAGASVRWSADQGGSAVAPSSVTASGAAISAFGCDNTPANNLSVFISGIVIVGGTSGNLQVQEAQATSSANSTTVLTNSFVRAVKVQ